MAKIIPILDSATIDLVESRAERDVYTMLQGIDDPGTTIIFSWDWVHREDESPRAREGEADFLFLVPSHGILVVEVKGGGITHDRNTGSWSSRGRHGEYQIKDPFAQAQQCKHQVLNAIKGSHAWRKISNPWIPIGHAVLFPDVPSPAPFKKASTPHEIIGSRQDLGDLMSWARAALEYWTEETERALFNGDCISACVEVLTPSITTAPLFCSHIEQAEQARVHLTREQGRILRAIDGQARCIIHGSAGTGKTTLCLEIARQKAGEGKSVLLLCYNRLLADYMKHTCKDHSETLHAMTYHELCRRLSKDAKERTGINCYNEAKALVPVSDHDEYETLWPTALYLACEKTDIRYDAIYVDEGQDFQPEYWLGIECLLRDEQESQFMVFLDPSQDIYNDNIDIPIETPPYTLSLNCRNTRMIHEAAYARHPVAATDPPHGNEGLPVSTLSSPSLDQQARKIVSRITELLTRDEIQPSQVAVLIAGEPKDAFYKSIKQHALPGNADWVFEGPADSASHLVRIDTVRRFKGLEAELAFLWGMSAADKSKSREIFYVGASRAVTSLVIVDNDATCKEWLEPASEQPLTTA